MALIKFDVLNRERLRALFCYDPETGVFTYKTHASRRTPVGSIAGSVNDEGYRHIRADGRAYKAHRLAWLYMTGEWPVEVIDHIDGNRDNNKFSNLREASRSQNLANSKSFRKGKVSAKGVRQTPSGWSARIQKMGRSHFLGYFESEAEARSAYAVAATEHFGVFARV